MDGLETKEEHIQRIKILLENKEGAILRDVEWLRENFPDLEAWLQEVSRFNKVQDTFLIFSNINSVLIQFATHKHIYRISAELPKDVYKDWNSFGSNCNSLGYLGCTAHERALRFGETHARGNDLNDGRYCVETWNGIVKDIVSYELERNVFCQEK